MTWLYVAGYRPKILMVK